MDVKPQTREGNPAAMLDETSAAPSSPHTPLDVVYVTREGGDTESLRYSLRSLANIPHGTVWISGGLPSWCGNVNHIYKDLEGNEVPEQEDSNLNLYQACLVPTLSEQFIFMNDDFFIMQPMEAIPTMHQGSLDAVIERYKTGNRFHQAYSLVKTKQELMRLGFAPGELLSYELHMPMIFSKSKVIEMFQEYPQPLFALRPRTMYGNKYKLKGAYQEDAKDTPNQEVALLSTGADFAISLTGERVRARFRTPSAHEQALDAPRA